MPRTATDRPDTRPELPDPDRLSGRHRLDVGEAAEHLDAIAELIDAGDPRGARHRAVWLTRRIDDDTRALLVQCLQALEAGPKVRDARLTHLLRIATPVTRALVVACLPRTDPRRCATRTPPHRAAAADPARTPRSRDPARHAERAQPHRAAGIHAAGHDPLLRRHSRERPRRR